MRINNEREHELRLAEPGDSYAWDRPIRFDEIFRAVIAQEIRGGRMTAERRRRIVRYAAGMGLNAVEAGRLIEECREEALSDGDPDIREHALRLVEPPPPRSIPLRAKFALALGAALIVHSLLRWIG